MEELLENLKEEVRFELLGNLTYDGEVIKWEYDCFGIEFDGEIEDHLNEIYDIDHKLINDIIEDTNYSITNPEIVDSFIFFYIE